MVYDNRGYESDEVVDRTVNNIKRVPVSTLEFTRNSNKVKRDIQSPIDQFYIIEFYHLAAQYSSSSSNNNTQRT